jgi:hypothetical protein
MVSTGTLTVIQTTKKVRFTDTTNYDLLGLDVSALEAKGLGTIYGQGEILVQLNTVGSPLIDLQSGATYYEFDAVLDANGDIANITYAVNYSVRLTAVGITIFNVTAPDTITIDSGYTGLANFFVAGNEVTIDSGPNAGDYTLVSATDDDPFLPW